MRGDAYATAFVTCSARLSSWPRVLTISRPRPLSRAGSSTCGYVGHQFPSDTRRFFTDVTWQSSTVARRSPKSSDTRRYLDSATWLSSTVARGSSISSDIRRSLRVSRVCHQLWQRGHRSPPTSDDLFSVAATVTCRLINLWQGVIKDLRYPTTFGGITCMPINCGYGSTKSSDIRRSFVTAATVTCPLINLWQGVIKDLRCPTIFGQCHVSDHQLEPWSEHAERPSAMGEVSSDVGGQGQTGEAIRNLWIRNT